MPIAGHYAACFDKAMQRPCQPEPARVWQSHPDLGHRARILGKPRAMRTTVVQLKQLPARRCVSLGDAARRASPPAPASRRLSSDVVNRSKVPRSPRRVTKSSRRPTDLTGTARSTQFVVVCPIVANNHGKLASPPQCKKIEMGRIATATSGPDAAVAPIVMLR